MKIMERIYEVPCEALQELEERLFDIGENRFAVEITEHGCYFKSYSGEIDRFLESLGYEAIEEREVDPLEWADNLLKEPFEIAEGVIVDPAGNYEGDGIVLRIPPGMAFGTGIHPTTKMCADFMLKVNLKGKKVLDVGTGSGILAILAKKLGAKRVVAVDNDPLAVEIAKENAANNFVEIDVKVSDLLSDVDGTFDIIVANIVPPVLERLADQILKVAKPGSILIISGIDEGNEGVVAKFLERGFWKEATGSDDGWMAVMLRL